MYATYGVYEYSYYVHLRTAFTIDAASTEVNLWFPEKKARPVMLFRCVTCRPVVACRQTNVCESILEHYCFLCPVFWLGP